MNKNILKKAMDDIQKAKFIADEIGTDPVRHGYNNGLSHSLHILDKYLNHECSEFDKVDGYLVCKFCGNKGKRLTFDSGKLVLGK